MVPAVVIHTYINKQIDKSIITLDGLQLRRREPRREPAHDVPVVVQDRRFRLRVTARIR